MFSSSASSPLWNRRIRNLMAGTSVLSFLRVLRLASRGTLHSSDRIRDAMATLPAKVTPIHLTLTTSRRRLSFAVLLQKPNTGHTIGVSPFALTGG